jgi:hypothetical protein
LRLRAGIAAVLVAAATPEPSRAAVKPGLEGAQELFRQNRWEEARAHVRGQWSALPEKDRGVATFLVGRSYVREAEFYRGLRRFGAEIGLAYLDELGSAKANRGVAWIPLFKGFYQAEAEQYAEAEHALAAPGLAPLPAEWRASARYRRAVALHRQGRVQEAAAVLKDATAEARLARLLTGGPAEPGPAAPKESGREKALRAAVLFRAGQAAEAEALVTGLNIDLPDVEDKSDPKKLFRFHDPLVATAWERIAWERAAVALKPLAAGGTGPEKALAAYYAGLSLFQLGATEEAAGLLRDAATSAGAETQPSARLLLTAASWKGRTPAAPELAQAWESTQAQPDAALLWDELRRPELAKLEPFAAKLEARLQGLLPSSSDRPSGALVGRWGLSRLRHGDEPGALVATLSEYRDKSNKNKLEWNDPLLLLALSLANYRNQEYAQALETLFELSKTFPGLRAVQWNLQGIYAARQKAGGEIRISQ